MKVRELIAALSKVDPEARVFHGYDSNIVVNEPFEIVAIRNENEIHNCWLRVEVGDVVIYGRDR